MLRDLLQEIEPDLEILDSLDSVETSVAWLSDHEHPDIIFMDIQLSDGLSFEIFKQVDVNSFVIFTTAYDEYAIQAFKVNSIDYLLKPIRHNDLKRAIEKSKEFFRRMNPVVRTDIDFDTLIRTINDAQAVFRSRFLIQQGSSYIKLPVKAIAYFYSKDKITYAVSFNEEKHILDITMEQLEEQLNPSLFYRANRQIILNVDAIVRIHNYFNGKLKVDVKPTYSEDITISRLKAKNFKQWLDR